MSWTSLAATYAIVWWLVLFTTLPFGIRTPDATEEGMEPGAPEKPHMWIKAGCDNNHCRRDYGRRLGAVRARDHRLPRCRGLGR